MPLVEAKPKGPIYIGVDPGRHGGMTAISGSNFYSIEMPDTERGILRWFQKWTKYVGDPGVHVVIEKIGGYTGHPQPGAYMFNFGRNSGHLEMAATAAELPWEFCTPQRWQNALGIPPRKKHDKKKTVVLTRGPRKGQTVVKKYGGETDKEWKERLRKVAERIFPREEITLGIADASLLARYSLLKENGRTIENEPTQLKKKRRKAS